MVIPNALSRRMQCRRSSGAKRVIKKLVRPRNVCGASANLNGRFFAPIFHPTPECPLDCPVRMTPIIGKTNHSEGESSGLFGQGAREWVE